MTTPKQTAKEKELQKQVDDLTAQVEYLEGENTQLQNLTHCVIKDQDDNTIDFEVVDNTVCITLPELVNSETVIPNFDLRQQLRLAMAQGGAIRVQHAHADAQNVDRAIDEILGVWGGE